MITCEIAVMIKKDMPKNKVKKFSIVDKKLKKFRDENHVQPNDPTVSRVRKCSQADKRIR